MSVMAVCGAAGNNAVDVDRLVGYFAERGGGRSVCHIIIGMLGYYSDRSCVDPAIFGKTAMVTGFSHLHFHKRLSREMREDSFCSCR